MHIEIFLFGLTQPLNSPFIVLEYAEALQTAEPRLSLVRTGYR